MNFIRAGLFGNGWMAVHSGGKLTSRMGVLGGIEPGVADVSGSNSTWTLTGSGSTLETGLVVGILGSAWLSIADGGTVSSSYAAGTPVIVGDQATGTGTITVNGANSKFTNSADLYLGNDGVGSLYIGSGGKATNYNGDLALNSGRSVRSALMAPAPCGRTTASSPSALPALGRSASPVVAR